MHRRTQPMVIAGVVLGLLGGLGFFTFVYARGGSYFTNDPAACVNCHVMSDQYEGWVRSSHRAVAVCNDCHAPHTFVGKYATKAINGFWHSFAFTSGRFPDNIRITPRNQRVTESACRSCHDDMVHAIDVSGRAPGETIACVRCHGSVGHLR
jgi:cytochrome c nitrite reductase small subunit